MGFLDIIKSFFSKKPADAKPEKAPAPAASAAPAPAAEQTRLKKTCKNCGKTFSYDPNWEHIPNYCKECKQQFIREKEEKQRAGAPRKIKRKCRECGNFFVFPSTLEHYPSYCPKCRKAHQAAQKDKYARKQK